ncbi:M1 family aminopeptidase [Chryseobacterium gregarium]|uniref:M1 family aminopeptidase n=1 Tax=Chryseobacterium gregarium TaxID=456299 RepID=UPI0003FC11FF|nr:M1 family aminopeptidase [Chryseobacterium gregarium]
MKIFFLVTCSFAILSGQLYFAQSRKASLSTAIQECNYIFEKGTSDEIKSRFPLIQQQKLILAMLKGKYERKPGLSKLLKLDKDSALVLLTGTFLIGNSGEETDYSNTYSGVYIFKPLNGVWSMVKKLPIDRMNKIREQRMAVKIIPDDRELIITDTINIRTEESYGILFALNHNAKIKNVLLNQRKVLSIFDGGVLWIKSRTKKDDQLILSYSLKVDQDKKNDNSGYFDANFGHVRDQYYWHPFFNFSSGNDLAKFSIKLAIPSTYQVATTLPQTDKVIGSERVVMAKSSYSTFALSLYYDKEWKKHSFLKGSYRLDLFGNDNFKPVPDSLFNNFLKTYDFLAERFGKPKGDYLSIVQNRSKDFPIWLNRSNDMIVAGSQGSFLIKVNGENPLAPFGHEVAHAWTRPIGPATNFLREGWASFAEVCFLENTYGDTTAQRFMANYKAIYLNNGFDGKTSLWVDESNGGVSYYKGVWVFYMLREQLGKDAFYKGLKAFIQSDEPMNIDLFVRKLGEASGQDLHLIIDPWIKSSSIPKLNDELEGDQFIVTQTGDIFNFPLEVRFILNDGRTILQTFDIRQKTQNFKLDGLSEQNIKSLQLDPFNKLLIK